MNNTDNMKPYVDHSTPESRATQRQRLMLHLEQGTYIDRLTAFELGIGAGLPARVCELRKRGVKILTLASEDSNLCHYVLQRENNNIE